MRGLLIDIEGIDGTGKHTQSLMLHEKLEKMGYKVDIFSYPEYESVYGSIIKKFLDHKIELSSDEQFLVYLLDMIKDKINVDSSLKYGHMVIMDRYFLSTIAYQCANGFSYQKAKDIMTIVSLSVPSIIFYLDLPIENANQRKRKQKGEVDRFESDSHFLLNVKKIYDQLIADQFPSKVWKTVNGDQSPKNVHHEINKHLDILLHKRDNSTT